MWDGQSVKKPLKWKFKKLLTAVCYLLMLLALTACMSWSTSSRSLDSGRNAAGKLDLSPLGQKQAVTCISSFCFPAVFIRSRYCIAFQESQNCNCFWRL